MQDNRTRMNHRRSRPWLALSLVAVIALGLASRKFPGLFPAILGKYPGDALWALMVFLGIAWLKPDLQPLPLAGLALLTSCLDEFSQLYQAPWINALRSTTLGHLVLGSAFAWQDLCAYTVGVAVGCLLDIPLRSRPFRAQPNPVLPAPADAPQNTLEPRRPTS